MVGFSDSSKIHGHRSLESMRWWARSHNMIGAPEAGNSQAATHQEWPMKENYTDLCVLSWLGRFLFLVLYSWGVGDLLGELVGNHTIFKSHSLPCIKWLPYEMLLCFLGLLVKVIPFGKLLVGLVYSFHSERVWSSPGIPLISWLK